MTKLELMREGEMDGVRLMTYSGRCMYGRRCMAYSLDSGVTLFAPFANMLEMAGSSGPGEEGYIKDVRYVQELLNEATFDQLGRGMVLYFPSVDTEEFERESDDES